MDQKTENTTTTTEATQEQAPAPEAPAEKITVKAWTAGTPAPGPRQVKHINDLISKIRWEGSCIRELSGVIGVSERASCHWIPICGPGMTEYSKKALNAAGEPFGYTLTRDNVQQVEAALISVLLDISRPEVYHQSDKRITPEAAAQQQAEREARRVEAEYPYLERKEGSTKSSHALAGANIRAILKKHFPGHFFTVKTSSFSGGDDCNVSWTDGPTQKEVKALIWRFEAGHFDGMEDIYRDRSDVWHSLFGDVKYLFAGRHISRERFIEAGEKEGIEVILYPDQAAMDRNKMEEGIIHHLSRIIDETSYYTAPVMPEAAPVVDHGTTPSDNVDQYAPENNITGAQVRRNEAKNGVEVVFPGKPSPEVIEALKQAGFRWSFKTRVWYQRYTPEAEAAAIRIIGQ